MTIAVLSGKGGTGKTFVSVNLARVFDTATYIDCDVEEPNGHLFFSPKNSTHEEVSVTIPQVHNELCTGCRKCIDFCKFNALAYVNKVLVFEEVCHSCGGCRLVCPQNAISEKEKIIGHIETGFSESTKVITGIMNIGESSGVPIIKKLLSKIDGTKTTIIDCPPGSACLTMESIQEADFCILVAEPSVFGMQNLEMVHELVTLFNKPFGVVLNKCLEDENPSEVYCEKNSIPILAKIPFTQDLARITANATIAVDECSEYRNLFLDLQNALSLEIAQ